MKIYCRRAIVMAKISDRIVPVIRPLEMGLRLADLRIVKKRRELVASDRRESSRCIVVHVCRICESPTLPIDWNTNVSLFATVTKVACAAGLVAAGMPITPSPFRSWWKVVSTFPARCWFPTSRRSIGDEVAAAVGGPDRILIGARDLPGNLIAGCRLLRADRRPAAKLTRAQRPRRQYFSSGPATRRLLSRK